MTYLRYIAATLLALAVALGFTSCIEDGFTESSADQPQFSTDTLFMGTVFTDEVTTTYRFTVRNPHSKGLNISKISLSGPNASLFRLNVDGFSGSDFSNIEIRAKDSIYVFVEATLTENNADLPVVVNADIEFVTNGVTSKVVVDAVGQDVERLRAVTIDKDTHFTAAKPYQIFDSLVVAEGVTLTLDPGASLCFHDKATMIVRGTLKSNGTVEKPVSLRGDRTGNVITDITFDLMSRQWNGLQFTLSSVDNVMTNTSVRNTCYGVIASGDGVSGASPKLTLVNCQLRNSGDRVLEAYDADVRAAGCEFAESANGLVFLQGGNHVFNHCTFANYYLFSAISGPAIAVTHLNPADDGENPLDTPYTKALFSNSIIYGLGSDITPGDLTDTDVFLRYCLLKSNGTDDDNFISCLWDKDPLYYAVREDYIFDYRLKPDSPAIGAGDPALTLPEAATDAYGLPRGAVPDLGAYVFTPPAE